MNSCVYLAHSLAHNWINCSKVICMIFDYTKETNEPMLKKWNIFANLPDENIFSFEKNWNQKSQSKSTTTTPKWNCTHNSFNSQYGSNDRSYNISFGQQSVRMIVYSPTNCWENPNIYSLSVVEVAEVFFSSFFFLLHLFCVDFFLNFSSLFLSGAMVLAHSSNFIPFLDLVPSCVMKYCQQFIWWSVSTL